ncbi:MAG: PDZ domain-containing protein [Oligoflexales bacterium]
MTFMRSIWFGLLILTHLFAQSDAAGPNILIMGSIVGNGPKNNVVLIKNVETSRVMALRVGHDIEGWEVLAISEEKMRLQKGEEKIDIFKDRFRAPETVQIERPMKTKTIHQDRYSEEGFERVAGKIRVTSAYKTEMLDNQLGKILMQASVVPMFSGGRITGFEISRIEPGSIYEKMGLVDGDIITEMNGIRLDNVAKAVRLLKSMRGDKEAMMKVMRGENIQDVEVQVE